MFGRLNIQHDFLIKLVYNERYIFDESINLDEGSKILDAGAGTGGLTSSVV